MPAGSAPGERRGGRKSGTPNKKFTGRDRRVLLAAEKLRQEMEARQPAPNTDLAKDILGKFAHQCADMAMRLYPQSGPDGLPIWRGEDGGKKHRQEFFEWLKHVKDFGSAAAPFQSPTFKAIAVLAPVMETPAPAESNVVPLHLDDHAAMRLYRQIVSRTRLP